MLLAGCGPVPAPTVDPPTTSSGASSGLSASPRGSIRIAYPKEPTTLNPKLTTGSGIGEWMWIFTSYLT